MRRWAIGTGVALAIALPATVVAQVLDAVRDDGLPAPVTVGLTLLVLAGPVVGSFVAGRQRVSRWGLRGIAIGAASLLLISAFGALRRAVADEDVAAFAVPALTVAGGLLGFIGDRAAAAGRTRP
jgi:hypothetical protein